MADQIDWLPFRDWFVSDIERQCRAYRAKRQHEEQLAAAAAKRKPAGTKPQAPNQRTLRGFGGTHERQR